MQMGLGTRAYAVEILPPAQRKWNIILKPKTDLGTWSNRKALKMAKTDLGQHLKKR